MDGIQCTSKVRARPEPEPDLDRSTLSAHANVARAHVTLFDQIEKTRSARLRPGADWLNNSGERFTRACCPFCLHYCLRRLIDEDQSKLGSRALTHCSLWSLRWHLTLTIRSTLTQLAPI